MRLCFIADARSPIARNWISFFAVGGHDVHVISRLAADPIAGAVLHVPSSPFLGGTAGKRPPTAAANVYISKFRDISLLPLQLSWYHLWLPIESLRLAFYARKIIAGIQPDLLHCLRIPIEGEAGALAGYQPLVVSVWGNDFTLFADRSILHRVLTRLAVRRSAALLADTMVDLVRAHSYGLRPATFTRCFPGAGGIQRTNFHSGPAASQVLRKHGIPEGRRIVINARGVRGYVRSDTYFSSISAVLHRCPDTVFVAVGLAHWAKAHEAVRKLRVENSVILTEAMPQSDLAELYRAAQIAVSLTEHDGTPNTLLESMACGCLPICGDLPSIREWITHGRNGLLVDVGSAEEVAEAIILGLSDMDLRERAALENMNIVQERADYAVCMPEVERLYHEIVKAANSGLCVG